MKLKLFAVLILGAIGAGAILYSVGGIGTDTATATEYLTSPAAVGDVTDEIAATGTLEPASRTGITFGTAAWSVDDTTAAPAAPATYPVAEVNVAVGDTVAEGDILATADVATLKSDLAQGQARSPVRRGQPSGCRGWPRRREHDGRQAPGQGHPLQRPQPGRPGRAGRGRPGRPDRCCDADRTGRRSRDRGRPGRRIGRARGRCRRHRFTVLHGHDRRRRERPRGRQAGAGGRGQRLRGGRRRDRHGDRDLSRRGCRRRFRGRLVPGHGDPHQRSGHAPVRHERRRDHHHGQRHGRADDPERGPAVAAMGPTAS